jgi:hypothetical protein
MIMTAMRTLPRETHIVERACHALGDFAAVGAENRAQAFQEHCVKTILDAMHLHPRVQSVQQMGCYAIDQLAYATYAVDNKVRLQLPPFTTKNQVVK